MNKIVLFIGSMVLFIYIFTAIFSLICLFLNKNVKGK